MANQVPNYFDQASIYTQEDFMLSPLFSEIEEGNDAYYSINLAEDLSFGIVPSTFDNQGFYLPLFDGLVPTNDFPQHQQEQQEQQQLHQQEQFNYYLSDNEGFSSSQASPATSCYSTPQTTPSPSPNIAYCPSPLMLNREGGTAIRNSRKTKKNTGKYQCERCDKCYTRMQDVKRHFKNHTNERTEVCRFCSKTFNRNDTLARHERTCSGNPSVQPRRRRRV